VELELIELFKQNNQMCVTVGEATEILLEHGHDRLYSSVKDNLFILATAGFLTYDKDEGRFSISPNAAKADLTKKLPCELLPSKPEHQTSDHREKCGKKFSHSDVPYVRSFANVQLYLCAECHEQKVVA